MDRVYQNMTDISRWQGVGSLPPSGGRSPENCPACGESTWIEIGGGPAVDVYHPNIDRVAQPGVDYVCDLETERLPFHDDHATKIKAIHALQHLSRDGARHVLRECFRVLSPVGSLFLMVGDFSFILERLCEDGLVDAWLDCVFHGPNDANGFGFHKWGYSFKTLTSELELAGFTRVQHRGWYNAWEFKAEAFKL